MKKAIVMFLTAVMLLAFAACTDFGATPASEATIFKESDIYDYHGFGSVVCDETGRYAFKAEGSDGLEWKVYVLDEEFGDALRYMSHAYEPVLIGDGELEITKGQWIYVECSANDLTGIEAPEDAQLIVSAVK